MKRTLLLIFSLVCVLTAGATEGIRLSTSRTALAGQHAPRAAFTLTKAPAAFGTPTMAGAVAASESPRLSATAAHRAPRHAPAMEGLFGAYVEDTPGTTDGIEPSLVCAQTELSLYEYTDPDTQEHITMVRLNGLCQGVADVCGEYDPEDGTLFIPSQICFEDPENMRVPKASLFGVESIDAQGHCVLGDGLLLRVEEDANGLYLTLDESMAGWALYAEEGEFKGSVVGYGEALILNPATHFLSYESYDIGLPLDARHWEVCEQRSFVEDLGDEVFIHGWLGSYAIRLKVKDDGTIVLPNGQNAYYSITDRTWWSCYTFGSDRRLCTDPTVEIPVCQTGSGTYVFGAPVEGDPTKMTTDILCWGYISPYDDLGYWTGVEFAYISLVPNEVWLEGVAAPQTGPVAATPAYDLNGRTLTAQNASGLFIQGGRKLIR